jgi:phosphopantothenoylcysteine decarboxylase/phosphopantothenate--cysteine ligase
MRILITSGPTREYLDPVRYLSNGSSGRMGKALAEAALAAGHEVVIVSGPVQVRYPAAARVVNVVTTDEMLEAARQAFPECSGMLAVAAPCDYRPRNVSPKKISKTGKPLDVELLETPDIVADLASLRTHQWIVGFALETEDLHLRAMQKLQRKSCDWIVANGAAAMNSSSTAVEVLEGSGAVVASLAGSKRSVARRLVELIDRHFPQK